MAIINYEITLDFVTNNYVAIRAKKRDSNTRRVIISCTSNGEEYRLDSGMEATIFMKKPDGHLVANPCQCDFSRNVVIADLTEQMLAVKGNGYAEVALIKKSTKEILATMSFVIVIAESAQASDDLISSNEFTSLGQLVITVEEMKKALEALEKEASTQEAQRQRNENVRISNENTRLANERQRVDAENARKSAESARASAETQRNQAEQTRKSAETVRNNQEQDRIVAEQRRVTAENTRIANENKRITAENKRQTDTAQAIQNCNTVVQNIENKLQNGELNGRTILYGDGVPLSTLGNVGDVYINTLPTGPYAYYLFTKETTDWKPRWNTQGIDGTDTLPLLSTFFLPATEPIPEGYEEVADLGFTSDNIIYNGTETLTQVINKQAQLIQTLQNKIRNSVYFA